MSSIGTNNVAEYSALLSGIDKALELGWKHVVIEGDSNLVVNQINGTWNVNKEHLQRLCTQVLKHLPEFDSYTINWIPRKDNSIADKLASKALGYKEDPYHFKAIKNKRTSHEINQNKELNLEISCPKCKRDCVFRWQEFRSGSRHIRQECPVHGYIKYAPQIEPYLTLVEQKKNKTIQKKLF